MIDQMFAGQCLHGGAASRAGMSTSTHVTNRSGISLGIGLAGK